MLQILATIIVCFKFWPPSSYASNFGHHHCVLKILATIIVCFKFWPPSSYASNFGHHHCVLKILATIIVCFKFWPPSLCASSKTLSETPRDIQAPPSQPPKYNLKVHLTFHKNETFLVALFAPFRKQDPFFLTIYSCE